MRAEPPTSLTGIRRMSTVEDEAHRLSMMTEVGFDVGLPSPVGTVAHHRAALLLAAWNLCDDYAERTAPAWDTSAEAMSPLIGLPRLSE